MSCCSLPITSCLPSCIVGDAPHWKEVDFYKLDANGDRVLLSGTKTNSDGSRELVLKYLEDCHTGDLYSFKDGEPMIVLKSSLIFIFNPLYCAGDFMFALVRLVYNVAEALFNTISLLNRDYYSEGLGSALVGFLPHLAEEVVNEAWPTVRHILVAPLFFLMNQTGALVGFFSQYDGRKIIVAAQRLLFNGATHKQDFRYPAEAKRIYGGESEEYKQALAIPLKDKVFFMALCFMPSQHTTEKIRSADGTERNKFERRAEGVIY
ncbi:MAG: hypothetical protein HYX48_05615 [Chlamydiales bacterium]|nr:hypothetical protein [Chlamydiales bacterium]